MRFNLDEYLARIGVQEVGPPTLELLLHLRRRHVIAAPFENLDVVRGVRYGLDEGSIYDKVVRRRRGGNCLELNGAFAMLLEALGFQVVRLGGRVEDRRAPPPELVPLPHMSLCVTLDEPYLVDVGSGPSFPEPMPLRHGHRVRQANRELRLEVSGDAVTLHRSVGEDAGWLPFLRLGMRPRELSEFAQARAFDFRPEGTAMGRHMRCSRLTERGAMYLIDHKLWIEDDGEGKLTLLRSPEERKAALLEHFGISLDADQRPKE